MKAGIINCIVTAKTGSLHFCKKPAFSMACPKGLEPPLPGIGIRCIIQLCYGQIFRLSHLKKAQMRQSFLSVNVVGVKFGADFLEKDVYCLLLCRIDYAGGGSCMPSASEPSADGRSVNISVCSQGSLE